MNKSRFIVISIVFLTSSGWLGIETHSNLSKFQRYKLAYAGELNFQNSLLDFKDYLNENEWNKSKQDGNERWKTAYRAKQQASLYGGILGLISVLYLIIFFLFFKLKKISIKQFGYSILNCSLVFLVVGISLPFLELGAYMEDLKINALGFFKNIWR